MKIKISYYSYLDGIRAIAALMVMFFHYFINYKEVGGVLQFVSKISVFGQTGVSLFFVLSGFLITRILMNEKQQPNYFYNFYMRRSLRIFPLYYFFLFLFYWLFPVLLTNPSQHHPYYYYWLYLQDFAMTFRWPHHGPDHFWSLAVEEHFYLFWPLVVYFSSTKWLMRWVSVLLLVALGTRLYLLQQHFEVFYFTFSRMDELAVGAILAVAESKNLLNQSNARKFLLGAMMMFLPSLFFWLLMNGKANFYVQAFKCISLALVYAFLLGYLISTENTNNRVKQLLQHPFLLFTGKISYGLYVYHPFCFLWYEKHMITRSVLMNFFVSCLFAFVVATLSYLIVEQRFLRLKKYFN